MLSWEGRGGRGEGVTPYMKYNGCYREAPAESDTFPAQASAISKGRELTNRILSKGRKS